MSIDPVTFLQTGNPGYFNRYAYTFNDPINLIDSDGRQVSAANQEASDLLSVHGRGPASTISQTHKAATDAKVRIQVRVGDKGTRGQDVKGGLTEIRNTTDGVAAIVTIDPSDRIEVDGVNTETQESASRVLTVGEVVEHELGIEGHAADLALGGVEQADKNRTSEKAGNGVDTFREKKEIPFDRIGHGGREK